MQYAGFLLALMKLMLKKLFINEGNLILMKCTLSPKFSEKGMYICGESNMNFFDLRHVFEFVSKYRSTS